MGQDHDGMLLVKADLCERLEALHRIARRTGVRNLGQGLAAIRLLAGAYGITAVECVASAFERAIRLQPRACPAELYFERLRDAVGCSPADERSREAILASISVRLQA